MGDHRWNIKEGYLKLMREGLIYLKCSINKNKMLYFLNKFHTKITIFMDTYIANAPILLQSRWSMFILT